uniref:Uncharacterized protein n=1 Tax=Rhipicephalus microplus TaxID=6941 RepID=A0A6G5AH65_RHIMP
MSSRGELSCQTTFSPEFERNVLALYPLFVFSVTAILQLYTVFISQVLPSLFFLFYLSTHCSSGIIVFVCCEALNPAATDNTRIKEAAVYMHNRILLFILSSNLPFFLFPKVRHAAFCFSLQVQVLSCHAGMSYQTHCY